MKLIFVHGWSVTHTDTYGELPRILQERGAARGLKLETVDLFLGRYLSFHNPIRMGDLVRAFDRALRDALPDGRGGVAHFSCITHSTGGPVVRSWVERYYGVRRLNRCPLEHLVMLAPANHGSALAALGSSRVGRLKAWFDGVEPGTGVLGWLELGSEEGRGLNRAWLDYAPRRRGTRFRPFVLSGETIDKKLYDYVNPYTGERGSDGVVRLAAANLDYSWLTLRETDEVVEMAGELDRERRPRQAWLLAGVGDLRVSEPCPFKVVPDASHSGDKLGIMRSPTAANAAEKPVVAGILEALAVRTRLEYEAVFERWAAATRKVQDGTGRGRRYFQLVVTVRDDQGDPVTDFDFILTAGDGYDPDKLPKGFFVDKQRNPRSPQTITFYLDFDAMMAVRKDRFGFRVIARPDSGFAYYRPVEFRSDAEKIDTWVDENTTLYVEIVLRRHVDRQTVRLDPAAAGARDFKGTQPEGRGVP